MEIKSGYPASVYRTLSILLFLEETIGVLTERTILNQLFYIQSQNTTQKALQTLIEDDIIVKDKNSYYLKERAKTFNWVSHSLKKEETVMVLGFPGSHSKVLAENLEKKGITYLDHYTVWTTLINNAKRTIMIMSPFFDIGGVQLYGKFLIDSLKRGVQVKIITRTINLDDKYSARSEAIKKFCKKIHDENQAAKMTFGIFHDGGSADRIEKHLGSVHAKIMIQDDKLAYAGSGEFRKASAYNNLEIGFLHKEKRIIGSLFEVFSSFWEICTKNNWREFV